MRLPVIFSLLIAFAAGSAHAADRFPPATIRATSHAPPRLGFRERVRGDHHIFSREDIGEIPNLQPLPSGKAKGYQVRQIRNLIVRYRLSETEHGN